ncbi:MAG: glycosyltransferase family 39 protein [Patescibacteria group bacterium]|nr:glycosyltransferase family 39 protein [Patescibacteria group bacterium]
MWKTNKKTIIFLGIILLLAGFLRLYALDSTPPGLYPDEAMNANDAFTNPGKAFYPENNGREGLYMNLVNLSFKAFDPSPFSLRLVSALAGILTVLGLYLLSRELYQTLKFKIEKSNLLALLASFFLAISFWHIIFSRIGFRGAFLPLILVFSFYFFFKGLRKKNIFSLIVSGIFFGLGFYTYSSFRLAFLILPFIVVPYFFVFKKEKQLKKFFLSAFSFIISTIIVFVPLGLHFLARPADFFGRLGPISIFSQDNVIKSFFISLIRHLGMFNISGDFNWRHNLSGSPQLLWPIGLLFLVGFIFSFKKFFSCWKNKEYQVLSVYSFLFGWFFVMILPGALTYEGLPHALRTIGIIPVIYIFTALGGYWLFEKLKTYKWFILKPKDKFLKSFLYFIIAFLFFSLFTAQFQKYFDAWGKNSNIAGAFTERFVNIGNTLNSLPAEVSKYIIVNEGGTAVPYPDGPPVSAQTIMFTERMEYNELRAIYLKPEQMNEIKDEDNKIIIIPMRFDDQISNELEILFPNGLIKTINNVKVYEIN